MQNMHCNTFSIRPEKGLLFICGIHQTKKDAVSNFEPAEQNSQKATFLLTATELSGNPTIFKQLTVLALKVFTELIIQYLLTPVSLEILEFMKND